MIDSIELLAASMQLDLQRFQAVSSNFANMNTTGYKADRVVSRGFGDVFAAARAGDAVKDWTPGKWDHTQKSLDFALKSPRQFFQLRTPEGVVLTRRGDFRLNAEGYLTSQSGHTVIGAGGDMFLGTADVELDSGTTLRRGEQVLARFEIVELPPEVPLQHLGEGRYRLADAAPVVTPDRPALKQGYIESSNVDASREMLEMMALTRHFELGQAALRIQDEALGLAIGTLGDTYRR